MESRFGINRRRRYYINKRFQNAFIIKFCSLVIAGAFLSAFIIFLLSRSSVTTVFENGRLTIKSTADFILPSALLSSAIVSVLLGFVTLIVSLFMSHRIVGPMYRMEKDLKEVMAGNLNMRFRLRKNDELKLLADRLDELTRSLKDKIGKIKMAADKEDLKDLKKSLEYFSV